METSTSNVTAKRGVAAEMLADVAKPGKRVTVGSDSTYSRSNEASRAVQRSRCVKLESAA